MNLDRKSQTHSNVLRDENDISSVKLPYIKSRESLSGMKTFDQPLSVHATGSFSASGVLKSGGGNHSTDTLENRQSGTVVPFEPLDEEGERYLRENMILPPIEEFSGTKYYINIAPTDGDLSSANSVNEWWNCLDYEDECCVEKVKYHEQEHVLVKADEDNVSNKRDFPITKKTIMERKLNNHNTQVYIRDQIISDLEKRMVSLYSLKKQYKKNINFGGCEKKSSSLPPIVGHDRLTIHRDSMINRIRIKKKENEDKLRHQLDRKLDIVQRILKEQQRNEVNKQFVASERRKEIKRTQNGYKAVQKNGPDESAVETNEEEHKIDLPDTAINTHQDKESIIVNMLPENVDQGPEAKLISDESPEMEPASIPKSPKMSVASSKKGKKKNKKSLKGTDKAVSKKDKGKKKKKSKDSVETAAATCEEAPELPVSEMPDLLLWFENWREETRRVEEIKSNKLPDETQVLLRPTSVTFEDVRAGRVSRRQVTVTNMGEEALRCRVAGVIYLPDYTRHSPLLKAELDGPSKATYGRFWTLSLTLEAVEEVEECKVDVRLEFCRADDTRSQLSVWANVLTPHAEPSMSPSCLRFGSQVFWSTAAVTKLLTISNNGARGCVVHWTKHSESSYQFVRESLTICDEYEDGDSEVTHMASEMLEQCFAEVFSVFRIDARQGHYIPPKSQVVLPVKFLPAMSADKGHVFCKYTFTFGGEQVTNSVQDLVVCGKIEDTAFKLKPDMLDMKVCYIGGNVQQAEFCVTSSARHACSVSARVPRSLAQQVFVVPKESIVQAHSSVCLVLRIVLSWSFLKDPSPYLEPESGLLNFPVLVTTQTGEVPVAPPLELRVLALVAPPCPLTLTPPSLDLGSVTTQETVCSDLHLTNHHHSCTYQFAFLDLPQSVVVEPNGGCGVVLPGETVPLQLLFSPSPKHIGVDCGRPGGAGDILLTLRCFTTLSLACPVPKQKNPGHKIVSSVSKSLSSTIMLSQIGDYGNGDIASSKDSSSRHVVGKLRDYSEVGSGTVGGGGGDFDDEPAVIESHLLSTINTHAEDSKLLLEDSASLKTNDVWDYFSSYKIGSLKNGVEILHRKSHELVEDEYEGEKETVSVNTNDSFTVTTMSKEDEINSTRNTNESLIENSGKEGSEDIVLNMDNQNASLVPLSKRNLELFEHGGDECYPPSDQRYASVSIHAHVTDPLVELSSQTVVLPPTHCQSYSAASIYIRSKFQKKCKIHERNTKFKTRFELKCDSKELTVEPRRGCVQYNQSCKLTLIFKPVLKQAEIYEKAFEMKMEAMRLKKVQELLDLYYQLKDNKSKKMSTKGSLKRSIVSKSKSMSEGSKSKKKRNSKAGPSIPKAKKRSKGSVVSTKTKKTKLSVGSAKLKKKDSGPLPEVVVDPAQVEVTEEDLREAEVWLLKYLEPQTKHLTLLCTLDTDMGNGERRQESLVCQVECLVVAPVLALCSPPCLQFGPTALGTSSRLTICVTNVSFLDVLVHLSALNPVGFLMCPFALETPYSMNGEGVELPPEHTLNIPILFQPVRAGEEVERFEVVSSGTILHLQAHGEGVVPSFTLTPDQAVFSFTYAANKKADIIISIENTCEAPLRFSFRQEFLKEGFSLPSSTAKPSPPLSPGGGSKKTQQSKPDKKSKAKQEITTWTPELISCLENEFTDLYVPEMYEPWFKFIDYDKHVIIPAGEIKKITVRFIPQDDIKSRPASASTKGSRKKSSLMKSKVATKKSDTPVKRKSSVKSKKDDRKSLSSNKSKANKNEKKRNRGSAGNKGKEESAPSMKVIAAKFTVLLADIIEVKDWLFLGVIKK